MALLNATRRNLPEWAQELSLEELFALGLVPPIAGASDEEETESESSEESETESESEESESEDDDEKPPAKPELNWKQLARRHEREAKKRQRELDALKADLKKREDADKSEQDKAIEQAKVDAVKDLETRHERDRRQDRLELESTKLAAKGLKIGEGDKAKTLKFADPDDAMVYLERAISRGDIDEGDLFNDKGRVKPDALAEALGEILEGKPHLAAEGKVAGASKVKGSADGGKGAPVKGEPTTVEDHLKKIRRTRPEQPAQQLITRRQ